MNAKNEFNYLVNEYRPKYTHFGNDPPRGSQSEWGPWAAIVWRSSRLMGMGCAARRVDGKDESVLYVVINFDPAGLKYSQFKWNVLPQKDTELYTKLTSGFEPFMKRKVCAIGIQYFPLDTFVKGLAFVT